MRKADLCLIAVSALLLFSLSISFFLLPQKSFSEEENRGLTTWKSPTAKELFDGRAAAHLSAVYADQFPLRTALTALKAQTERLLGKRENNGVFFGTNGGLIPRNEYASLAVAQKNLAAVSSFFSNADIPCSLLIAPRAMDVMIHSVPTVYSPDTEIFSLLSKLTLPYVLPLTALRSAATSGETVWYKTDHHWTSLGAYLAYTELMEFLGYAPHPLSYFTEQTVSQSFLGTSHAKIGGIATSPDTVTLFRYQGDEEYVIINRDSGQTVQGFYAWEALEKKDQYQIFLGGNFNRLSISLPDGQNRPRMLLIKDSFANALVPFLALHFDLELVDLRYYERSLTNLLANESFDCLLIVQGIDTLATDKSMQKLLR